MESPGKFIEDEELREAMKEAGLGTPATRAEIIEKLLGYGYMERHGNHLAPTSRGIQVVSLAPKILSSPELTAQWELRLDKISHGKENPGITQMTIACSNSLPVRIPNGPAVHNFPLRTVDTKNDRLNRQDIGARLLCKTNVVEFTADHLELLQACDVTVSRTRNLFPAIPYLC